MSNPAPDTRYSQLIQRLYERTLSRKLPWKPASARKGYEVVVGQHVVNVHVEAGEWETNDIHVELYDMRGKLAEAFTDNDVRDSEAAVPIEPFDNWFDAMNDLLRMIDRQTRGADDALDGVLAELGEDEF